MTGRSAFDEQGGEREAWRGEAARPVRPHLQLPTSMPRPKGSRESSRVSALISFAFHVIIILLLLLPALLSPSVRSALATGAGGAGPQGGGGGSGGLFGPRERIQYIHVAPEAAPTPTVPVPKPVATPIPVPAKPVVTPPTPQVQPQATPPPTNVPPATSGAAGAGNTNGGGGAGPGTGGGTGSGVGTGIGSANGPGTGGGIDSIYPPQLIETFVPPIPYPSSIRGSVVVAQFDVDSTGKVLNLDLSPTRDGGYNKKLRAKLSGVRFRPAVNRDGRPVRATVQLSYTFY
jgi:hypothetical protein